MRPIIIYDAQWFITELKINDLLIFESPETKARLIIQQWAARLLDTN